MARTALTKAEFSRIFLTGFAFDSGGNVDAPGMEQVNRFLHVAGMQAAGHDQLADAVDDSRPGLDALPVKSLSSAAASFCG
jgi:hypothetical protein